jgi:DNA-directed RNA polymerase subunit L
MEHSYDISLRDVDYTVGKVLEYMMFTQYYEKEQIMTFCGFKKFHPHNLYGVLRIAFSEKKSVDDVREYLRISCMEIIDIFEKIKQLF